MTEASVNSRAQQVLKILVERFIQDGLPIGSKTLAEEYELGLSPATIRNILAELEEAGHLKSPHTSAGRIPTEQGYRFFVDSLLTVQPLEGESVKNFKNELNPDLPLSKLLFTASSILSNLSNMTGIVALPKRNCIKLRQVEFLALSLNRVLVILVLNNHEVQNRIIYTDQDYSQQKLQQAATFLNTHYAGKDLLTIRKEISEVIRHDHSDISEIFKTAMDVTNKVVEKVQNNDKDYIVAGQNKLLNYMGEVDLTHLQALFDALSEKENILNLLDQALEAQGIQIFIGKETKNQALGECSLVTTSYSVGNGEFFGSLGVIGPTRMPYDKVISAVDVTAKLLSAALNQT